MGNSSRREAWSPEELTAGNLGSIGYLSTGDVGHVGMVQGYSEDCGVEFRTLTGIRVVVAMLRTGQIRAASETRSRSLIRERDPS